jgi:CheY-like chemotaxis protein
MVLRVTSGCSGGHASKAGLFRSSMVEPLTSMKPRFRKSLKRQLILASDGLEAVQKAQELQPESIPSDIGLPKLNGLGVGRRAA